MATTQGSETGADRPPGEDGAIAAEIGEALGVHGIRVEVRVRHGEVVLEGSVSSGELRTVAGRIAEQTAGASRVANHLRVRGA